ncbi:hypothetical protein KEM60_01613 [Austwickia sp. TVS 96-490-7B]|nr:hypothetical protein [Austwickia sp. TVS 96-490-7B]
MDHIGDHQILVMPDDNNYSVRRNNCDIMTGGKSLQESGENPERSRHCETKSGTVLL